jgi:glycosyltransferase
MLKKITIITVVKNEYASIDTTVKSVLSQTYPKIEYIIIDGNSKDGTYAKLQKYKKYSNVKILKKNDKNLYEAINYGIQISNGDYIGFLHAGDRFLSNCSISKILRKIKFSCDFFFSKLIICNKKKRIIRKWGFSINKKNFLQSFFKVAHPTLFINKKIKKKIKYDTNFYISADTNYLLDLSKLYNLKWQYVKIYSIAMENVGLSNSWKNLTQKIYQDISILTKRLGYLLGLYVYLNKVIIKIPSLLKFKIYTKYLHE